VAEAARYLEGAQDLPVVSHDPCQIMAGRRSDFIRRFRWTVVVGNWRPPKSTKVKADSHHFPHCLMMFNGNFTVKKKNISFRHVRNLHQMIMLVTSYRHVSPIFYQTMKPIDGLICLIRRKPLLSEVPEVYHYGGWHLATSWSALWTKDFFEDVLGCPWVSQNEGLTVVEKKHPIGGMVRPFSEKPLF